MILVEEHRIEKGHPYYEMIDNISFIAKNIYNSALFIQRQYYLRCVRLEKSESIEDLNVSQEVIDIANGRKYIDYYMLDKLAKKLMNTGLRENYILVNSEIAQQTLRQLDINWKSFFKANKDYKANSAKYKGSPRPPRYLKKDGRYNIALTYVSCKIKDGYIKFPKRFQGLKLKTKLESLKQVKIVPKDGYYSVYVAYEKQEKELKEDNGKYLSIDIGTNNLAAITNNFNGDQYLISGRPLKAVNQHYNQESSRLKSIYAFQNIDFKSKKLIDLSGNRNDFINTYLHKASKRVVDLSLSYGVSKIVIGYNKDFKFSVVNKANKTRGYKTKSKREKRFNQNFTQIPLARFIDMIKYKARLEGIEVITVNESYTSGTSFLDNEMPTKENYNKNRRISRGCFVSNNGRKLNADINGSYQILKKFLKRNYYVNPEHLSVIKIDGIRISKSTNKSKAMIA